MKPDPRRRSRPATSSVDRHCLPMKTNKSPWALARFATAGFCLVLTVSKLPADVVTDWNVAMTHYSETLPPPGIPPFLEARAYAMAHIAMRDAINENAQGHGSVEAAVAQAAHDVLVVVLPDATASFDALLATHLAAVTDPDARARGQHIGAREALRMLAERANDGSASAEGPYTPGSEPGDYQFTPPFDGPPFNGYAAAPYWGEVKPFALKTGSQFRAPAPYEVTDLRYAFDLNEIKAFGSATSTARSLDQTHLALFWYENSPFAWNRIARIVDAQHSLTLVEHAKLFASLNAALCDAYIASLDSKYTYNFWRPITGIRLAATDGNDATAADPTWEPLFLTPPIPDYPSGHAAAGGAAAQVLIATFGDEHTFELTSTMSFPFPEIQPRTFHRISDAANENAASRMLVGIHFRLACEAGLKQGQDVGNWVDETHAEEHALISVRVRSCAGPP